MTQRDAPPSVFQTRTIVLAIAAALTLAVVFVVLTVFAPDLRSFDNGGAHALSRSSVGYAGIVRLLQADGERVLVNRNPKLASGDSTGLLILTPEHRFDHAMIEPLIGRGYRVLIIPSKWRTVRDTKHPGWVSTFCCEPQDLPVWTPNESDASAPQKPDVETPDVEKPDVQKPAPVGQMTYREREGAPILTASGGTTLYRSEVRYAFGPVRNLRRLVANPVFSVELRDGQGHAVLVRDTLKNVYYLTDPDILNNQSLRSRSSAEAAVAMIRDLREGNGPIIFDTTLNGTPHERSIFKVALQPPFLAATLCLFGAALLLGWRNIVRFGPTFRPGLAVAPGKRLLVENAAGLIRLNGRTPRMAGRYAALIRNMVARSVAAPRNLNGAELDAYLDRVADPTFRTRPFSDLMANAQSIQDEAGLLRSARELFRFRTEVMRERK